MNRKTTLILIIFFCIAPVLVLLGYIFNSGHIWEDFFITFRCSKNLAEGNGLVYHIGERVHVFTSPLGVLLPALTYILSGKKSYVEALWLFRILFCIPAFIGGGICIFKMFLNNYRQEFLDENEKNYYLPFLFIALFYIFDAKSVMFTMNGMETGLMLFFFMLALYLMQKGIEKNWLMTGIAWGGLMWTRPDSCFYIGAMMVTSLVFRKKDAGLEKQNTGEEEEATSNIERPTSNIELNANGKRPNTPSIQHSITPIQWISNRKVIILSIIKASVITTVIYLPWFIWAWVYYGSPVPNTVLAKSAVNPMNFGNFFNNILIHPSWAFSPVYPVLTKWPKPIELFSIAAALFCGLYWLIIPIKDRFGKSLSFTFLLISFYFALMPFPYPWYYPPLTILGFIIIVNGIWQISKKSSFGSTFAKISYSIIFLNFLILFFLTSTQMKMQQKIIENGLRKQIGLWLKEQKEPGDTIYLEPLGYIGYFSEGKMSDYPGLSSPENVKLISEKGCDFYSLIEETKPDWVIIRPFRRADLEKMDFFLKTYRHVGDFSAIQMIKDAGNIPGKGYLEYDSVFKIYRNKKNKY